MKRVVNFDFDNYNRNDLIEFCFPHEVGRTVDPAIPQQIADEITARGEDLFYFVTLYDGKDFFGKVVDLRIAFFNRVFEAGPHALPTWAIPSVTAEGLFDGDAEICDEKVVRIRDIESLKEFDLNNLETIPENIAKLYQDLDNKANRQAIINHFQLLDESHLYPINSKFNATKKAIKALSEFEDEYGDELLGLELALFLDGKISEIVNDPELV